MQQEELGRTRGAYKEKEIMTMKKKGREGMGGLGIRRTKCVNTRLHPETRCKAAYRRSSSVYFCVKLKTRGLFSLLKQIGDYINVVPGRDPATLNETESADKDKRT